MIGAEDMAILLFVIWLVCCTRVYSEMFHSVCDDFERVLPCVLASIVVFPVRLMLPPQTVYPPLVLDMRVAYGLPDEYHWPDEED